MIRLLLVLAGLLLLAGPARAAGWVDCSIPTKDGNTLSAGKCSTWTETGGTASSVLYAPYGAHCTNTGGTDFTVHSSVPAGTQHNVWVSPVQYGVSCSPNSGNTTCGNVYLDPGWYVFVPDATGAGARCIGVSP